MGDSDDGAREPPNEGLLSLATKPKDESTRPQQRTTFYAAWVQNWWLYELLSLTLGTVSIIAICFILIHYQNKPAPELNSIMGMGITLNTIIAILATVGRASLLLPVAECISQQKWAWFSGSARLLTELEVFDQGSRGALGSLVLLWRINVQQFVSIGAFLLIFGLAVDPLSQQLIHYNRRPQADPSSPAYVSTALTWATASQADNFFDWEQNTVQIQDPPLFMQAAVQNGLLTSGSVLNETLPFCATGNCTWPLYRSLAVCMRWQDVSAHVEHAKVFDNASKMTVTRGSLTDRNYIQNSASAASRVNMSSVAKPAGTSNLLDFSDSIAFSDNPWPLADVFLFYRNFSRPEESPFNAFEFVLEWCVQEFNSSVVNGTALTTRQSSAHKFSGGEGALTGPKFNTMSNFGANFAEEYNYYIDNRTHLILSNYLRKTLRGSVRQKAADFYKTSDAAETFWHRFYPRYEDGIKLTLDDAEIHQGLTQVLQNTATSMTNVVRQIDQTSSSMDGNQNVTNIFMRANGTAWREQTFVHVQWGWIAAPVTLALLSVVFVVATIVQSSVQANKYMNWKSSSLSTLMALSEELHLHTGGLRSPSENANTLRLARASLKQNSESEWRLQGSLNK